LITVAALLLGMVLLRRRHLWSAVAGWLVSMYAMHVLSEAGVLPFLALSGASLGTPDVAHFTAERAAAAALIYIPLALVMDHLISVWREDERNLHEAAQLVSLTGAYTRGFAVAVMQRALLRASEDDRPLAVLMVDLDHFKRINDAHGHARGDIVLKQTTHAIQSTLRADDIVGRFGGEEFVVLLPGADLRQAMGAAERCRAAVETMKIPGAPYLAVTASVGVAAFPDHGDELDGLLKASDRAMYEAKSSGRNRIEHAKI
jgi:diguanylate cyclase (GGDEF)-like protein